MGNTRVWFLVFSTFPQLIYRSGFEFREGWVALLFYFRLQKLTIHNHTPTLLHIYRRD